MTGKLLRQGRQFRYETPPQEELRCADVSYNNELKTFCIWFNGKLETFRSFQGMKKRLDRLIQVRSLKEYI